MKKLLFSSFLVASLASSLFGADLLASATNAKLSDNIPGVKALSPKETKQVKSGNLDYLMNIGSNELFVLMKPTAKEVYPNIYNTNLRDAKRLESSALGQESYKTVLSLNNKQSAPAIHNLGHNVKINVNNHKDNKSYRYKNDVAAYENVLRTYQKINSSYILNNHNAIIKRLTNSYKNDMEHILKAKTRVK
ncbi:hypothetical protein [Campylobacter sp.]|uniref:hypothetical protein n=1 Tax=Campylobacter sp. TaxID=205 RepID=UPI002A74D7F7|nr:hypothetical protein [Campylobacter sp.]MDY3246250.1 hypothetical protein [Campylobacter sp.]